MSLCLQLLRLLCLLLVSSFSPSVRQRRLRRRTRVLEMSHANPTTAAAAGAAVSSQLCCCLPSSLLLLCPLLLPSLLSHSLTPSREMCHVASCLPILPPSCCPCHPSCLPLLLLSVSLLSFPVAADPSLPVRQSCSSTSRPSAAPCLCTPASSLLP